MMTSIRQKSPRIALQAVERLIRHARERNTDSASRLPAEFIVAERCWPQRRRRCAFLIASMKGMSSKSKTMIPITRGPVRAGGRAAQPRRSRSESAIGAGST